MNTLKRTNQMTVVTVQQNNDRGQFAKYDRFAQRVLPKKGKIRAGYEAGVFGFRVAAKWAKTPQGRQAIRYWITKSKYSRYGTIAVGGGLIYNALQSVPQDAPSQQRQKRTNMVSPRNRRRYCRPSRKYNTRY